MDQRRLLVGQTLECYRVGAGVRLSGYLLHARTKLRFTERLLVITIQSPAYRFSGSEDCCFPSTDFSTSLDRFSGIFVLKLIRGLCPAGVRMCP